MSPNPGGDGSEVPRLLDAGHTPPGGLSARGGGDRHPDVVTVAVGRHAEELERGGVSDLAGDRGARGHPGAVDQDGRDVGHKVPGRVGREEAGAVEGADRCACTPPATAAAGTDDADCIVPRLTCRHDDLRQRAGLP